MSICVCDKCGDYFDSDWGGLEVGDDFVCDSCAENYIECDTCGSTTDMEDSEVQTIDGNVVSCPKCPPTLEEYKDENDN